MENLKDNVIHFVFVFVYSFHTIRFIRQSHRWHQSQPWFPIRLFFSREYRPCVDFMC